MRTDNKVLLFLLLLVTVCLGRQWKNLHQKVKSFQAAPPAVADETDSGAADPLTFCAGQVVSVNWRNGGGLEPLSPASPLLLPLVHPLHLGFFDAGLDSRSPEHAVGCCCLKVPRADAAGLQVTLADIFVAQSWSPCWPRPCGELTIQDVLRDAPIIHSAHMAEPTQSPLSQHCVHAWHACP